MAPYESVRTAHATSTTSANTKLHTILALLASFVSGAAIAAAATNNIHQDYLYQAANLTALLAAILAAARLAKHANKPSHHKWRATGDDRADFLAVFRTLTDELVGEVDAMEPPLPPRCAAYIRRMVEYNVPKGKLNRGLTVVEALRAIKAREPAPHETWDAAALGWGVEWLQAYFLVADDIMDASETRRGQPCWYKLPDVQLNAINDGILLESHIYTILKRHFGGSPLYVHLLELFHETTLQTALGQYLDLATAEPDRVDFGRFSMRTYSNIVIYKTAFYTFYLPVALAMRIAGITDESLYATARRICIMMGEYFQVQDDFLDCYGDPAVIGKVGTDIYDNKCSWLINTALPLCDARQRGVLEANYARHDPVCEARVKAVYDELKLRERFHAYEEETYKELNELIASVRGMPPTIFTNLLKRIYKRKK